MTARKQLIWTDADRPWLIQILTAASAREAGELAAVFVDHLTEQKRLESFAFDVTDPPRPHQDNRGVSLGEPAQITPASAWVAEWPKMWESLRRVQVVGTEGARYPPHLFFGEPFRELQEQVEAHQKQVIGFFLNLLEHFDHVTSEIGTITRFLVSAPTALYDGATISGMLGLELYLGTPQGNRFTTHDGHRRIRESLPFFGTGLRSPETTRVARLWWTDKAGGGNSRVWDPDTFDWASTIPPPPPKRRRRSR